MGKLAFLSIEKFEIFKLPIWNSTKVNLDSSLFRQYFFDAKSSLSKAIFLNRKVYGVNFWLSQTGSELEL